MIEQGLLFESGLSEEQNTVGRKKILLKINKNYKYIVGINIERNEISIGISDLSLSILSSKIIEISKSDDKDNISVKIGKSVLSQLWQMEISKDMILGIGVGVVGKYGEGSKDDYYAEWKEAIENNLDLPVVISNNVRALALSHMLLSEDAFEDMLFVKYVLVLVQLI